MSGSEIVRAYRGRKIAQPKTQSHAWRMPALALGVTASIVGFGSIIVRAADDSGVYEVAKQYATARGGPRFQLPQIFQPAPRPIVRTSLSYAPVARALMPMASTGKRTVDAPRNIKRIADRKTVPSSVRTAAAAKAMDSAEFTESYLSSRTSYCVRSCDGFFFPIGNADTGSTAAHEASCARACPGAETAVYVAAAGSKGIDDAINRKGQRYQATVTAFNYRTQLSAACSCNGAIGAARNYSVLTDFTLRPGDLVMSREGLKVFRDSDSFPYRPKNFGQADAARLSAQEKRWTQSSEAASMRGMTGGKLSPSLEQRITRQVEAAKGKSALAEHGLRGFNTTIALGDGRQLRYVGPDRKDSVLR